MLFLLPKPVRRVIYLVVLLGLLAVVDVAAKAWAEHQIEELAERQFQGAASIDVEFSGFPFLGRLLLLGEVDAMDVTLREVARQGLTYGTAGVRLTGIEIDRGALISDRELRLLDLDTGTAFAEITQEELSRITGQAVTLRPGVAEVAVAGQVVQAGVSVEAGQVVIRPVSAPPVPVAVPSFEFLPCASRATVLSGRVRLSCAVDTIPAPLVRAASDAVNQGA